MKSYARNTEKLAALLAKAEEEKQKSDLKQRLETLQNASIVDLSLLGIKTLLSILKRNPSEQ